MLTKDEIISKGLDENNTLIGLSNAKLDTIKNWFEVVEGYGFTEQQVVALYLIKENVI